MAFVEAVSCGLVVAAVAEVAVFSLGMLAGSFYDICAKKITEGGDLFDETFHAIFARDSYQIKEKIDCLALRDLKTSYEHYSDGMKLLSLALRESREGQEVNEATVSNGNETLSDIASNIVMLASTARSQATRNVVNNTHYITAQELFKTSCEKATNVCNNEGLSITDRIVAFRLRIAATIAEKGHTDPEATFAIFCMNALKGLHDLEAVKVMLAVFFKRGTKNKIKANFRKKQRLENIQTVLLMNYALLFCAYENLKSINYPKIVELIKNWPIINHPNCKFHPIYDADLVLDMHENSFIPHTLELFKNILYEKVSQNIERVIVDPSISTGKYFAVNSHEDIIVLADGKITIICHQGETKTVTLPENNPDGNELDKGLAIDNNDLYDHCKNNIFVVRWRGQQDENEYVLYVIDQDDNIVEFNLSFLHARACEDLKIACDQIGNLVIIKEHDDQVYICDDVGQLKSNFQRSGMEIFDLGISDPNDIMIVSDDRRAVHVYTTAGGLSSTLELPEGYKAGRLAFHHNINKIAVLTHIAQGNSSYMVLLFYSTSGELEDLYTFCKSEEIWKKVNLTSSPNGRIAIRHENSVTFLINPQS